MIKKYLNLIKFSHTIFALPFAMIGFTLGVVEIKKNNSINIHFTNIFIFVLICMVTARSAAMAFNRYLDRKIDALNYRTKDREIPTGKISILQVKWFIVVNIIVFIFSSYKINERCFYLSPIALFVILFYSYTKKITPLCHLVLGIGLSLSTIGAYIAVTNQFSITPILFSTILFLWVAGFDIIYALQDYDFDVSQKLFSIPSYFGISRAIHIAKILHFICICNIWVMFLFYHFKYLYFCGAFLFTGIIIYQYTHFNKKNLTKINPAFMTLNGVASIVFAIFVILDLIIK
ncbi:MAG: putative 4-hydroxybenzoate polyprenyltransferase [Sediminibacterium sp.]|nr:putative 4-hydroxybenzoate polyprenyltransferase [Sediminibacterium sp.]